MKKSSVAREGGAGRERARVRARARLNPTVMGSVATPDHEPVPYTTSIVSLAIVSHEKSVSPSPQSHDATASARFEEPVSTTTGYSYAVARRRRAEAERHDVVLRLPRERRDRGVVVERRRAADDAAPGGRRRAPPPSRDLIAVLERCTPCCAPSEPGRSPAAPRRFFVMGTVTTAPAVASSASERPRMSGAKYDFESFGCSGALNNSQENNFRPSFLKK